MLHVWLPSAATALRTSPFTAVFESASAVQVSCYTFGCPRVGNHAFAADYATAVPDTWHVINDQDVVVHGMKFFGWYKRNGQRVILDGEGGIVVRPSMLELSLLQVRFCDQSVCVERLRSGCIVVRPAMLELSLLQVRFRVHEGCAAPFDS